MSAVVLAVLAGLASGAGVAQPAGELPAELEGVGITQRLDDRVPLGLEFRDENGKPARLATYFREGKPVVLVLAYYRCPMLCNLVVGGLVETLKALPWTPGREFEVLTVSIDPRESAEQAVAKKQAVLSAYGRQDASVGWHFLTGQAQAIQTLADAVGFRYRYLAERDEFAHAAAVFVLTPDGRLSRYLFGIRHDPDTLRLSLVEAAEGRVGSVLDQFLLYCYRYDTEAGRYVPVAWKIMRLCGVLTVVVLGSFLVAFWLKEARHKGPA